MVVLAGAAVVTVPDRRCLDLVRDALDRLPAQARTDPDAVRAALPVVTTLGPAVLAYCDDAGFRPHERGPVEPVGADDAGIGALAASVPTDDIDEAGPHEITSTAYVVRSGADVVAVAGYSEWPDDTAHLHVLTATAHRGRGLARLVAAAAVADALAAGMLPQWRARPAASRRVARALGFRELGSQLSLRLTE
jgi:GNAT superfamily N-acetyltransferase